MNGEQLAFYSTLDFQPSSLRHRSDGTNEVEKIKTHAVDC